MLILNIQEVGEDVFNVTMQNDDMSVVVFTFHGKEALDNYILEGLTNASREHAGPITGQFNQGRLAGTSGRSVLFH